MQHRDCITLQKILEETAIAKEFLKNINIDAFLSNEMLKRAVSMTVINIGELVKNLTNEFRMEYKDVPWKDISGFRDIAAHKYKTLDMELVYNSVKIDIPELENSIKKILNQDKS